MTWLSSIQECLFYFALKTWHQNDTHILHIEAAVVSEIRLKLKPLYLSSSLSQSRFIQIIITNPMHLITIFVVVATTLALFTLACVQGKRWVSCRESVENVFIKAYLFLVLRKTMDFISHLLRPWKMGQPFWRKELWLKKSVQVGTKLLVL